MPILWGASGEDQQQDRHMRGLHAPEAWGATGAVSAQPSGAGSGQQTEGGRMTDDLDGGTVVWVVGLACLALVLGLVLGALVLAGVL